MAGCILRRLLLAEDSFLLAVQEGSARLEAFKAEWTTLLADFEAELPNLDSDTVALGFAVASRLAILADQFADLHEKSDVLNLALVAEMDNMLAEISLSEIDPISHLAQDSKSPDRNKSDATDPNLNGSFHAPSTTSIMSSAACYPALNPFPLRPGEFDCTYHKPSLVSWSSSDESEDGDLLPSPIAGQKRSATSLDEAITTNGSRHHVAKRSRMENNDDTTTPFPVDMVEMKAPHSYPWPCLVDSTSPSMLPYTAPESTSNSSPPLRRKRCLSDADTYVPKRPRGASTGPRPYVVSDPLPAPCSSTVSAFDSWFSAMFEGPNEISTVEPDIPGSLDIQVSDDWTSQGSGIAYNLSAEETVKEVPAIQEIDLPANFDFTGIAPETLDMSAVNDNLTDLLSIVIEASLDDNVVIDSPSAISPQGHCLSPSSTPSDKDSAHSPSCDAHSNSNDHPGDLKHVQDLIVNSLPSHTNNIIPESPTEPDVLNVHTVSSHFETSAPGADPAIISQHRRAMSTPGSPPPSFLESLDIVPTLQWRQSWNPFQHFPDINSICPPPPYYQSSDAGLFSGSLVEEIKPSGNQRYDFDILSLPLYMPPLTSGIQVVR